MDEKKKKIRKILESYGYDVSEGLGKEIYNRATATSTGADYFLKNYQTQLDNYPIFTDILSQQNEAHGYFQEARESGPYQGLYVDQADLAGENPRVKTYDKYLNIRYGKGPRPGFGEISPFVIWTDPVSGKSTKKWLAADDLSLGSNESEQSKSEDAENGSSKNTSTGSGGGSGQRQASAPKTPEIPNPYINIPKDELEWRLKNATSKEEAQQIVDALRAQRSGEEDSVPQEKQRQNLLGNLSDAGRAILGYAGALDDVPHYKMSRPFDDYVRRTQRMSEMGFTQEEKQAFNDAASNAYAYDVKSIKSLAGGSAGAALANLGRAADRLYDSKVDFASRDAAVKRQNLRMFGQAAQGYEQVNRQIFQDELTQAMMNKEAGAALARDAVTNMLNRNQYEKMYGSGSHFSRYQNLLMKRTQAEIDALKASQENVARLWEDKWLASYDDDTSGQSLGTVEDVQDMHLMRNATPDDPTGKNALLDQTYSSMTRDLNTGEIRYKDAETGEDVVVLPSDTGGATVTKVNPDTGISEKSVYGSSNEGGTVRSGQVSITDFEGQNKMREQFRLKPYTREEFDAMLEKEGYIDGGMTKGDYNHKTNPLAVIDKNGKHTGMELTGGEGVFDKPAMRKIEAFAKRKDFEKLGMFVAKEMQTWDK